jgi:hypothetical protein
MFKKLLLASLISGIILGVADYCNFNSLFYFFSGAIAYGLYETLSDVNVEIN